MLSIPSNLEPATWLTYIPEKDLYMQKMQPVWLASGIIKRQHSKIIILLYNNNKVSILQVLLNPYASGDWLKVMNFKINYV